MLNDIQLIAILATILKSSGKAGSVRDAVDTAEQAYHEIFRRNVKHAKKHIANQDPESCEQCKTGKFVADMEPRIVS